jgi:hypothetical protein
MGVNPTKFNLMRGVTIHSAKERSSWDLNKFNHPIITEQQFYSLLSSTPKRG